MKDPIFKVKEEKLENDYGEFIIEPLQTGFGHTIGNALRRIILSSIQGAAVTSVKIAGVKHKFSTVPGLKENVVDLLLNIKGLSFKLSDSKTSATVTVSVKGPKEVTAGDLELPDGLEIVDKNYYLGSLTDKKSKLDMELTVEKGYGYTVAEEQKAGTVGLIPTDAIFTPVNRVTYTVEATRVGRQTNLDRLILKIWTNGTISPKEVLEESAKILSFYSQQVYEPKNVSSTDSAPTTSGVPEEILRLTVDELDLPTRIYNSLRNGGIETLGQLIGTPKKDLMGMRNMGGKSIGIIEEKLRDKGISLSI